MTSSTAFQHHRPVSRPLLRLRHTFAKPHNLTGGPPVVNSLLRHRLFCQIPSSPSLTHRHHQWPLSAPTSLSPPSIATAPRVSNPSCRCSGERRKDKWVMGLKDQTSLKLTHPTQLGFKLKPISNLGRIQIRDLDPTHHPELIPYPPRRQLKCDIIGSSKPTPSQSYRTDRLELTRLNRADLNPAARGMTHLSCTVHGSSIQAVLFPISAQSQSRSCFRPVQNLIWVPSEVLDAWQSPEDTKKVSQQLDSWSDLHKPVFYAGTVSTAEDRRFRLHFQLDLGTVRSIEILG